MSALSVTGLPTMTGIQLRTGWRAILGWVLGLLALTLMTTLSVAGLYTDQAEIDGYARTIGADGGPMAMLNGRIAGIDTLGGIMANEFAVLASFAIPLMAIALVTRGTRRDEEAGRLELLLAARIGRQAPLLAALLVTSAALALTCASIGASFVASGADEGGSLRYALGLLGVGLVAMGVAALAAQVFERNRAAWGASLGVVVLLFLLRGAGTTADNALVWVTPFGWLDEMRSFGRDARLWPVLISLAAAVGLAVLALVLNSRRDVGDALVRGRSTAPRASRLLRSPFGLALHTHRGSIIGWTIGAVVLMGMYGGLLQTAVDAIEENPALRDFLVGGDLVDAMLVAMILLLGMLVAAYTIQALSSLRREESEGRLEVELTEGRWRVAWLGTHTAVVLLGALVVLGLGALAFAASTATSLDDPDQVPRILGAGAAQLPGVLLFAGLAIALLGWLPRWWALAWAAFGVTTVIAYMGPGLQLPQWMVDATPFAAVGQLPGGEVSWAAVAVLLALATALLVVGHAGFVRRDVPRG